MKKSKKILAGCILMWFLCQQAVAGKIFDESVAVPYETFRASHTVEDATLFIGTYLIHVQALTDELYEKAKESASDSSQMNIYYKSELASGAWMDITDAGGLSDLAGQGTVVEESEIFPLWVTCYTGSDGITRDARDDHVIDIFSEPSPYDLYSLAELEPIKIQYSNVFSPESEGVDRYYYEKLRDFFSLDLQNEITQECDLQLLGLKGCYESLRASGKNELAEIVSKLMSRIDSRRRAEIFSRLSQVDGNELSVLQDICSGSQFYKKKDSEEDEENEDGEDQEEEEDDDDYDGKQFVENSAVIDAIGTAIQNCQESYIKHAGNVLTEGDTVLKNAEYEKSMAAVEMAQGGYGSGMEALLVELTHLYHLEEDVVADADAELSLLDNELLSQADLKYAQLLTEGAGSAYQTAAANGSSQSVKNQVLEDQKAKTDAARLELQYLLQSKSKRQPSGEAAAFLYQRIEHAEALYGQIKEDDYQSKARESIDAHILWLKELARSVEEEDETLESNLQRLEKKKTGLLEEQTKAMDQNDLSTVKKYDVLIEQVDREIEAEEQRLQAILTSASSSAAEKARAANQTGESSVLNNINQIKDAALLEIAEGNTENQESIMKKLNALSALGAESAIAEIRDKMRASGNDFQEAEKQAEQAILDSRESSFHDRYGGAGGTGGGGSGGAQAGGETGAGTDTSPGGSPGGNASGGAGTSTGTGSGGAGTGAGTDGSGAGTAAGTGGGAGTAADGGSAGEEDPAALVEDALGAPFDELNDRQQAAAVTVLHRMGQSGNQRAAQTADTWLNMCVREGNRYVFQKLKREAEEYLPLPLIASCTGHRYVYSDSRTEVTLSKKLSVCRFQVYRDEVQLLDGVTEKLSGAVKAQGDCPYLSEEDARQYFDCEAEYIDGTEYGICLGPKESRLVTSIEETIREGRN